MCARASSQQSAIEPVAAVAAPTEGRRELAAPLNPVQQLFRICTCSCTGDVIVCTLVGRCGDKGRCGVHIVG